MKHQDLKGEQKKNNECKETVLKDRQINIYNIRGN